MDWLGDNEWAGWLTVAVALAGLEIISLDLVLIGGPLALQVAMALISAVALLAVIRPGVVRQLHSGPDLKTGADALIGQRATVLREMSHSLPGRVKIGGEEWTAAPYDEDDHIEAGAVVDVVQIKGATAYVLRTHRLEPRGPGES
jgi:membrane protein implicated in regulation of membrane protease activity